MAELWVNYAINFFFPFFFLCKHFSDHNNTQKTDFRNRVLCKHLGVLESKKKSNTMAMSQNSSITAPKPSSNMRVSLRCGHNMPVCIAAKGTLARILLAPAVNQFECESGERTAERRPACLCACGCR